NAPNKLSSPEIIHTERAARSLPTSRVISAGTIKMAEPIMIPMTIAVVSHNPRTRRSRGCSETALAGSVPDLTGSINTCYFSLRHNRGIAECGQQRSDHCQGL